MSFPILARGKPDARLDPQGSDEIKARPQIERLWTKDFVLVLLFTHVSFAMYYALASVIPVYASHLPGWQIGIVVGAAGAVSLVLRLPSGGLADRFGRRPFLRISAGLQVAAVALLVLGNSIWFLTPLRVLWGVAVALYATAIMASLADVVPPSRRGMGMAWWGLAYTTSQFYASSLGLWMVELWGFDVTFLVLAAGAGINLACAVLMSETRPHFETGSVSAFSRIALPMLIAFVTLTTAQGAMLTFLVLYDQQTPVGDPKLYFLLFGISQVGGRWAAGVLCDRVGRLPVIVSGTAIVGISMLMLWWNAGFEVSALLFGAGFAFGHTGLTILTIDRSAVENRGAALATLTLAWDIGFFAGSLALGLVGGLAGYATVFAISGALPLLSLPFLIPLLRSRRGAAGAVTNVTVG
jgi:predicted MFS family arabinose efflux permease